MTDPMLRPGQAAQLKVEGLFRFHALDRHGYPLCMVGGYMTIYDLDFDTLRDRDTVPEDMKCHRWGCNEAWSG